MKITFIPNCYAVDKDITYAEINDIRDLPHTDSDKYSSALWSPLYLLSRKANFESVLDISMIVYDIDQLVEPNITYEHYVHQTHSGKWRLILPLAKPIKTNAAYYSDLYQDIADQVGLKPSETGKNEEVSSNLYDKKCIDYTRFFILPPRNHDIVFKKGDKFNFIPVKIANQKQLPIYQKPYYPDINEELLDKIKALSWIYNDDADLSPLARREGCWLHPTHGGSLDINSSPPSIYCYHDTCHDNNISFLNALVDTSTKKLSRTEAYLLVGLYRKLWDWNFIESLYLPTSIRDKKHILKKFKYNPLLDIDNILEFLYDNKAVYITAEERFYVFVKDRYVVRTKDEIASDIKISLGKWYLYKNYTKEAFDMSKEVERVLMGLRERGMGKIKETQALHLQNGALEIIESDGTYKFHPIPGEVFNRQALNYSYDPEATCPLWDSCVEAYFDGDLRGLTMQEWAGFSLSYGRKFESLLIMFGEKRAGKNTFADILRELVGGSVPTLKSLISPEDRANEWFHRSLFIDEGFKGDSEQITNLLKLLTAKTTPVSCRNLFGKTFNAPTFGKIMFAFNKTPDDFKIDDALAARIVAINFTKTFLGKEDRNLHEKLKEELPGILNWALKGWVRLNEQNRFTQSAAAKIELIDSTKEEYEHLIEDFIENILPPGEYKASELYEIFLSKLSFSETSVSSTQFGKVVKKLLKYKRGVAGIYYSKTKPLKEEGEG